MEVIISIDPGKDKCGLVVVEMNQKIVLDGRLVRKNKLIDLLNLINKEYSIKLILLGNGTTSNFLYSELSSQLCEPIKLVDEKKTTLRSKERYLELWPPFFLFSWFPKGLIFPPKNLDSIAALIILEDYFDTKLTWPGQVCFKIWPEQ